VRENSISNQQIRSFIAIELPSEIKAGLLQLQTEMKSSDYTFVKWVNVEGIHLTLKFLGNIPSLKVDEITGAMSNIVKGIPPFQLETACLGVFPNIRRPNVFWIGISGDLDKLSSLQERIDSVLEQRGFPKEKRAFNPHLTLARIKEDASVQNRQEFGKLIENKNFSANYQFEVNSVFLMRSQLLSGGAVYHRLSQVILSS
jgi:2'-5' RNA ligase